MRNNFTQQSDAMVAEYEQFREKLMAEYEAHCQQVKGMWGDDEVVESEPKRWVEYSDDLSQRSIVDFESGDVKVEILIDADQANNTAAIEQQLQQAVEQLMTSRGKSTNYKSEYEKQELVSDTPIVASLIDTEKYTLNPSTSTAPQPQMGTTASTPPMPTIDSKTSTLPKQKRAVTPTPSSTSTPTLVSTATAATIAKPIAIVEAATPIAPKSDTEIARAIVEETKYSVEERSDSNGDKKVQVSINLELNKNHVSQRAAKYSEEINKNASRFAIEEALIYSIMEQESSFNPMAKSHIPAYGLMQLVPSSGGRDSYTYVYKKDVMPTSDYLYKPENNIELGTAYLKVVKNRYFSKVNDMKSQMLCMIASYNAGAGGLSRAINGTTNIFKAIPTINDMSYDELYTLLRAKLPAETQDYIYKVTRNYDKYTSAK